MGKKEKSNTNLQYSNFNYCPLVGYFCYFKSSYKIQLIQKRLKIILNNNKRDYETLLENPIWTTMNNKKMRNLEIEVFKTINKLNLSFMKKNICKKKKKNLCLPLNDITVKSSNTATCEDKSLTNIKS